MKIAVVTLLIVALGVGLFAYPFPISGSTSFGIWVPESSSVSMDEMMDYAEKNDWAAELAQVGVEIDAGELQQMLSQMTAAEAEARDRSIHYRVKFQSVRPLFAPGLSRLMGAMDYIRHSLQLEAKLRGYKGVASPRSRRSIAWYACASGLDARVKRFFAEELPRESDPECRSYLEQLQACYRSE